MAVDAPAAAPASAARAAAAAVAPLAAARLVAAEAARAKASAGAPPADARRAHEPPPVPRDPPPPKIAALPEMVRAALERVDVDVRKDLLLNVLLTGGGSCFQGMADRLYGDVSLSLSSPFKVKVVAPSALERKFGVWIGGSILSSLGSFQQMWLSRAEYDDEGAARLVDGRWD